MGRLGLVAVVAVAAAVRLYALQNNPVALNQDEAVNGYDAYCLLKTLRDHHGHVLPVMLESFGDWVAPLCTYLTIPFVWIFGLSEFAVRLPVALIGTATVPLLYVLVRRLSLRAETALLAAAILAVSPWSITLSRWAIPPSIVPFFVIVFALALFRAAEVRDDKRLTASWRAAVTGIAAAALTYAYSEERLFVPLLLAAAVIVFFRRSMLQAAVLILVYLVLIAPVVFATIHEPGVYAERFGEVSGLRGSVPHALIRVVLRYGLYLTPISLFGSGDSDVQHHVPGFGSTFAFLAPFFYLGVMFAIAAVRQKGIFASLPSAGFTRPHAAFLLIWLALTPVPAALTMDYMHVVRGVHGLPLIPIFAAVGCVALIEGLASVPLRRASYATLVLLGAFATVEFMADYLTNYRNVSKEAYQYGLRDAIGFVLERNSTFRTIIVDDAVNQPYVYVLFYSHRDPRTLNYADFVLHGERTVRRLGKFRFEPFEDRDTAKARLIHQVRDKWTTWYSIYETADRTCLIERTKRLLRGPEDSDFPSQLKAIFRSSVQPEGA